MEVIRGARGIDKEMVGDKEEDWLHMCETKTKKEMYDIENCICEKNVCLLVI